VVQRPGRRSHELLCLDLQELEDHPARRYGKEGPGPEGSVMTGSFQLEGQEFMALNGGPHFKFTPAISLFVNCKTQEEVDELWDKLSAGGAPNQCGWVQDKFGLSWQIIPTALGECWATKTRPRPAPP
jgi:predicted 3-demethylubiquinone-9 3-methyltransferase (glyoxalase superfamily)